MHVSKLKTFVEADVFPNSELLQSPPTEDDFEVKDITPGDADEEVDNDSEEDHYEVEEILDQRFHNNENQYLVKWKGYTARYNSWVTTEDLNAPDLLSKFKRQQKGMASG